MRAPSALATSSTASAAVSFCRSKIGFTSTTSSDEARPDSATSSSARCASRYDKPAAHRRADAGCDLGIDDVHVEAHVHEPRPGDVGERLADRPLDAEAVDVAHREHLRAELPHAFALALVERAHADERDACPGRSPASATRRSRTQARRGRARPRAPSRGRCRSARSPACSDRRARRARERRRCRTPPRGHRSSRWRPSGRRRARAAPRPPRRCAARAPQPARTCAARAAGSARSARRPRLLRRRRSRRCPSPRLVARSP